VLFIGYKDVLGCFEELWSIVTRAGRGIGSP